MSKRGKGYENDFESATITTLDTGTGPAVTDAEIAELAYQRWINRGCPSGTDEEDWFEAERELKSRV